MPILLIVILFAVLVASFGFWDSLAAILGGTLLLIIFLAILAGFLGLFGFYIFGQFRRR